MSERRLKNDVSRTFRSGKGGCRKLIASPTIDPALTSRWASFRRMWCINKGTRRLALEGNVCLGGAGGTLPPIVGSLFSWKSLLTNLRTSEDYEQRYLRSAIRFRVTGKS